MNKIKLSNQIKEIMHIIIDSNYECYLVGGTVRDNLLNIENKDYDFATNIPFDKLKEKIPALVVMKENNHRNTAILKKDNHDYEFSLFKGKDIYEDLSNRDFKMNALAVDLNGNIMDPYNGLTDIENKEINLIKPNGEGLIYDPLRILRGIRLKNQCNFKITEETREEFLKKSNLLKKIAPERIVEELKMILVSDSIEEDLLTYKEVFFALIPELIKCDGFDQHNDYHIYDVYTHIVKTVANTENNYYLRLAALFHDIGKPSNFKLDEKEIGHFLGHVETSLKIFNKFSVKYKLDNKTKKIVSNLIKYHEDELSIKPNKIFDFYKKYNMNNIELLFSLKRADIKAQNPKYLDRLNGLKEVEKEYLKVRSNLKEITYNGNDLLKLGIKNQEIGHILEDIKRNIINKTIENNYRSINKYVKNKYIL